MDFIQKKPKIDKYVSFYKMHGAGNDFILIDGRRSLPFDQERFALFACHRNFGIGSDGLIILETSDIADYKMVFFDPDGTRTTCGNGLRCLGRYIVELGLLNTENRKITVETDHNKVTLDVIGKGEKVRVDMGPAIFEGKAIPTSEHGEHIDREFEILDMKFQISAVSMGNPHAVIFVPNLDSQLVNKYGPIIEHHEFFPKRTNVNFVEIVDDENFKTMVWERGVGRTLSCGTGICASFAIANRKGLVGRVAKVAAEGGEFEIQLRDSRIVLTGPTEIVFEGRLDYQKLLQNI